MDIYSENILDYYKNPRNKGKIKNPTNKAKEKNPLCGDEIQVDIKIEKNKIKEIKFSGQGCAISQASISMLTEKIIGKTTKKVLSLKDDDIIKMLGIPISPARTKCAVLGLQAIKKALK